MEEQVFKLITAISYPGVIFSFLWLVVKPLMPFFSSWLKTKVSSNYEQIDLLEIGKKVDLIGSNHLHEVRDLLETIIDGQDRLDQSINRMADNTSRSFSDIKETLGYIKAKVNGDR